MVNLPVSGCTFADNVSDEVYDSLEKPNENLLKAAYADQYGNQCRFDQVKAHIRNIHVSDSSKYTQIGFESQISVKVQSARNLFYSLMQRLFDPKISRPLLDKKKRNPIGEYAEFIQKVPGYVRRFMSETGNHLTASDYVNKHVEPPKRRLYRRCLDLLLTKWRVIINMKTVVKTNEKQLEDKKPRILCTPSDTMYPCGVVAYNMLNNLKRHMWCFAGLSMTRICSRLWEMLNRFKNPVVCSYDLSAFDAHQHVWTKEAIINTALESSFDRAYVSSQLPPCLYPQIYRMFATQKMPITAFYPRQQGGGKMMKGVIRGLTYTGHPLTTLGNTLASLCYISFIAESAGVQVEVAASGDDTVVICEQTDQCRLDQEIDRMFASKLDGTTSILGQTCKVRTWSTGTFTFLSRLFFICVDRVIGCRFDERVFKMSNVSDCISKNIPVSEMNSSITAEFLSWSGYHPFVSRLIELRLKFLVHSFKPETRLKNKYTVDDDHYISENDMRWMCAINPSSTNLDPFQAIVINSADYLFRYA